MEQIRVGKFTVMCALKAGPEMFERLRIAQYGCAVIRCEHQAYGDFFEVIAEHPSFALVDRHALLPEYDCEFTRTIGGEIVRTFKRKAS